jgi:hypothetical protein
MEQDNKNPRSLVDMLNDLTGLTEDERMAVYNEWMKDAKAEQREQVQADDVKQDGSLDWLFDNVGGPDGLAAFDDVPFTTTDDTDEPNAAIGASGMAAMKAGADATQDLMKARRKLLDATLNLNDAKARFEDAKVDAYVMGSITGKNAEEREARLAQLLEVQIHNVRNAEREWLKAKVEVECCVDTLAGMDRLDRQMDALTAMLNS